MKGLKKKQSMALRVGLIFSLAGLLALSGCISKWADPGPSPALLKVNLTAAVSQAQVRNTKLENDLVEPISLPGMFHRVTGPFWDWGVYLVLPKGDLRPLKPAGGPLKGIKAMAIHGQSSFYAPPGQLTLRIIVEGYLIHSWSEGVLSPDQSRPVGIVLHQKDFTLNLKPGGSARAGFRFVPKPK